MAGTSDMTYEDAVARLGEALAFGINPSLEGIRALTDALGRPQDAFRCMQITGTNGKTSVARIAGALLHAHGYRTGVYTSPHLDSYAERIEVDGQAVGEGELAAALQTVFEVAESIPATFTEFEILTATALHLMRERKVEWACLEVGMGGRWDATSVVAPAVAVITGVALDHTERLGATREEIAADKAHIIKPGSIGVIGPGCDGVDGIFLERAREQGVQTISVRRGGDVTWQVRRRPRTPGGVLTIDVSGLRDYEKLSLHAPSYQAPNVATAMAAVGAAMLSVLDPSTVRSALRVITFPGRFELLRKDPPLVIDGAHNPEAAAVLAGAISEAFGAERPVVVLGVLADKDVEGIVRALAPVTATFIATQNASPRCVSASDMAGIVAGVTGVPAVAEPVLVAALEAAGRTGRGVVVTGSLYTAGEARALLLRQVARGGVLLESR